MPSRFWADRPLLQKGLFVVAVPLLVIVLLVASSQWAVRQTRASSRAVQHTLQVRAAIAAVLTDLGDAEAGARGMLLTDDPTFVGPYVRGSRGIPLHLAELGELVADNPIQVEAVDRLGPLVEERMATLEEIVLLSPEERAQVPSFVLIVGQSVMDEVRHELAGMASEEARLLTLRRRDEGRAQAVQRWIMWIGLLVGFCGGAAAVVMFARTVVSRVRAIEHGAKRLEAQVPIGEMPSGRDEVGELGRSIAHAAAILAARERALADQMAEVEDLYNRAPCGYHSLDVDGRFVRVNDTELEWLGYDRADLIGRMRFADLLTEQERRRFVERFAEFQRTGVASGLEFDLQRADGTLLPVTVNESAVHGPDGSFRHSRSTVFDVSERRKLEDSLRELATVDELTGLLNLRGFRNLAGPQLRLAERGRLPLLVLFADLDDLKLVNDTQGHEAGSRLLAAAGALLRDCLRESDVLGRVGGDEFCAVLPLADAGADDRVVDRIRETVARWNAETAEPFELSMSIGIARLGPGEGVDLDTLIRRADEAMYEEKQRRRARGTASTHRPDDGAGRVGATG